MTTAPEINHTRRMVPSGGVIHLIRTLENEGIDCSGLNAALPLDFSTLGDHNSRIDAAKLLEVYELAMALPVSADFWLRLGDSYSVHNYHLELSNWILTAKNFAELIPKLHGLYAFGSEDVPASPAKVFEASDGRRWLKLPISAADSTHRSFQAHVELSAATLMRGFSLLLGSKQLEIEFYFEYDAPDHSQSYEEVLGSQVVFSASETAVHMPRDYIFQTFVSSDPVMHQYYEEQLNQMFPTTDDDAQLVARVEAILLASQESFPSLIQVCDELHIGERTLRRGLQKQGISYRQLLLNTKMKRAQEYLLNTDFSIEEIAHRLDYSDYANFRRAFQAQFEQTPSNYRKQHGYRAESSQVHDGHHDSTQR